MKFITSHQLLGPGQAFIQLSPDEVERLGARAKSRGVSLLEAFKNAFSGLPLRKNGNTAATKPKEPLTTAECEITAMVSEGYTNPQIAERRLCSEQTIKNHLHNIFGKIGVKSRDELAVWAKKNQPRKSKKHTSTTH